MKGIEFRVWDKSYKQYAKPYAICLDGRAIVVTEPCNDLETLDSERVIIEQYTVLKDKNGQKIYEGDILEFDNDFDDSAQRYVPYFDEKLAAFGFKIYGYQDYISESGSEEFESEMSFIGEMENYEREEIIFNTEYISIIGNIHDNPELLEVNNEI